MTEKKLFSRPDVFLIVAVVLFPVAAALLCIQVVDYDEKKKAMPNGLYSLLSYASSGRGFYLRCRASTFQ
jgi:hypothetical protein